MNLRNRCKIIKEKEEKIQKILTGLCIEDYGLSIQDYGNKGKGIMVSNT